MFDSLARSSALSSARQVVVLISSAETDFSNLAHRIWKLVNASSARVLLIGLCNERILEPTMRRNLATISALISHSGIFVETEVLSGPDWVASLRRKISSAQAVVCVSGYSADFWGRSLSRVLQSQLNIPLYILPDEQSLRLQRQNLLARVVSWSSPFVFIPLFFILQVKIVQATHGIAQTILMSVSAMIECLVIWAASNLNL